MNPREILKISGSSKIRIVFRTCSMNLRATQYQSTLASGWVCCRTILWGNQDQSSWYWHQRARKTASYAVRMAKNLRRKTDQSLTKIFIHQDRTPRQREGRHQLVQKLKSRQGLGETDLISQRKIVHKMQTW
jgi:hypothetical protein